MNGPLFYSQHGEDFLLYKFFESKNNRFYVDVGAFDGVHLSNSYLFEKLGWQGICVEANPRMFELCKKNRENSICVNVACVGDSNLRNIEFHVEELGLLSGINPVGDVKERYENRGLSFSGFEKVSVPAATLNSILEQHSKKVVEIDFLSIDVEGTELDVLKGIDLGIHSPRVMVIEANDGKAVQTIDKYVVDDNGYFKARTVKKNIFYVREPTDVELIRNIVIDCKIEKTIHPLGEAYTIQGETGQENSKTRFPGYWRMRKYLRKLGFLKKRKN